MQTGVSGRFEPLYKASRNGESFKQYVCSDEHSQQHTSSHHFTFHCPLQLFHHVYTNVCMFVSQAKKKKQTKKPVIRPLGTQAVTQQKVRERKPVASDKTIKEVRINHTFDHATIPLVHHSLDPLVVCVCTCFSC